MNETSRLAGDPPLTALVCALLPKLEENCASETGTRSPIKKVAGFPSSARSNIFRPERIVDKKSEKFSATSGRVYRKVVIPPPKDRNAGNVDGPKIGEMMVGKEGVPPVISRPN